jgi:hypothetical protein
MSKEWTREEDEKLVYDYEHVVMPYLENRLKHISGKVGLKMNETTFREDNQRMLELMRQGISLINNASGIRRIMRRLDPEKCVESLDKLVEEAETMIKDDYDRLLEVRHLLEDFIKLKNLKLKEE